MNEADKLALTLVVFVVVVVACIVIFGETPHQWGR